jgi:DNA-binding FadR family transcriptional regulator
MMKTRSRSATLALDILGRIARGELGPGDAIDLQDLERRHQVSRTVVREALADLGGKGLVVARPKVGTLVAAREQWNLLDPTLLALAVEHSDSNPLAREALELRAVVEPAIARAAAAKASRPQVRAMLDALRAMDRAMSAVDFDAWCSADASFHDALATACGNRLLQSIDRSLAPVRATQRASERSTEWHGRARPPAAQRVLALQTSLGVAVARRNPTLAGSLSMQLATRDVPALGDPDSRRAIEAATRRERMVFAAASLAQSGAAASVAEATAEAAAEATAEATDATEATDRQPAAESPVTGSTADGAPAPVAPVPGPPTVPVRNHDIWPALRGRVLSA